jgi:hypothetical protein
VQTGFCPVHLLKSKKQIMKYILFLFGLALMLSSCQKEKVSEEEGCIPISEQMKKFPPPPPTYGELSMFSGSGCVVGILAVNPFNGDEFLMASHIKLESDGKYHGLYRYNLKTGERIELPLAVYPTSSIHWSRKDWLLFIAQNGPLQWDAYKMKSNGDSLTRLTSSGNIHEPVWNWEGDKFICYLGLTSPTVYIIFDENGNPLDTVPVGAGSGSWQHPKGYRAGYVFTGSFRVTHPESHSVIFVLPVDDVRTSFMGGTVWIDEENAVWSSEHGVFRTNFVTGQTVQLIASCDAIRYAGLKYSFDTGRLISVRTVRKMTSGDKGTAASRYVTIDPYDGAMEFLEVEGCE